MFNFINIVYKFKIRKNFKILLVTLILSQTTNAQLTNCLPCDQLGMVMNVGSQETAISIYHSGQYLTHPQSENIFIWEFSDQQGNLLHKDISQCIDDIFWS